MKEKIDLHTTGALVALLSVTLEIAVPLFITGIANCVKSDIKASETKISKLDDKLPKENREVIRYINQQNYEVDCRRAEERFYRDITAPIAEVGLFGALSGVLIMKKDRRKERIYE